MYLHVLKALAYLHAKIVVQFSMKTINILLDTKWENLVVSDLDHSSEVNILITATSTNKEHVLHRFP